MDVPYAAVGFLYHPETGKILLHHRDANASHYPEQWAGFGGMSEESDHGDPVATWRREMREELSVELTPAQIRPLCTYVNWHTNSQHFVFYAEWPSLDEHFALTEGDGLAWFSIEDALALSDLLDLTRYDLTVLGTAVDPPGDECHDMREQAYGAPDLRQQLYLIADELRGMATLTKRFADNVYHAERGDRMLELAARIAALAHDGSLDEVKAIFDAEGWRRVSPAIGVDAAVFNAAGEILLLRRRDNEHWCMPGGVAEIGQATAEAVLRELWEEAGLRGEVERLLGVFDGPRWGSRSKVHMLHLVYLVRCDELTPIPGIEMLEAGFFAPDALPVPLHASHERRVPKCFELVRSGRTYFDPATSYGIAMPMHQRPGH